MDKNTQTAKELAALARAINSLPHSIDKAALVSALFGKSSRQLETASLDAAGNRRIKPQR